MESLAHVYSYYHLVIRADSEMKREYPITRRRLYQYILHCCRLLTSELLGTAATGNDLHIVFCLNGDVSLGEFIVKLKSWTSHWITGLTTDDMRFWTDEFWIKTLSPEDKPVVIESLRNARESADESLTHELPHYSGIDDPNAALLNCHHLIFTTRRARLLLPKKFISSYMTHFAKSARVWEPQ